MYIKRKNNKLNNKCADNNKLNSKTKTIHQLHFIAFYII